MELGNSKNHRDNVRVKISTLWVVVMFNMIFADILSFVTPGVMADIIEGNTAVKMTPTLMFVFALLLEIPMAMIFLSRYLKPKLNRTLNIIAAVVTILFVVGGGSLYIHYIVLAGVEVICMIAIIILSVKWGKREAVAVENEST